MRPTRISSPKPSHRAIAIQLSSERDDGTPTKLTLPLHVRHADECRSLSCGSVARIGDFDGALTV